jgi:hypothetical protein
MSEFSDWTAIASGACAAVNAANGIAAASSLFDVFSQNTTMILSGWPTPWVFYPGYGGPTGSGITPCLPGYWAWTSNCTDPHGTPNPYYPPSNNNNNNPPPADNNNPPPPAEDNNNPPPPADNNNPPPPADNNYPPPPDDNNPPPPDDHLNNLVNQSNSTPEPATLLLVASGLGGVGAMARRRKAARKA